MRREKGGQPRVVQLRGHPLYIFFPIFLFHSQKLQKFQNELARRVRIQFVCVNSLFSDYLSKNYHAMHRQSLQSTKTVPCCKTAFHPVFYTVDIP